MTERIEVGDLTVAVKWHPCGCGLGRIRKVAGFVAPVKFTLCGICNGPRFKRTSLLRAVFTDGTGCPVEWLRKIPPIDELQEADTVESISA